MIRLGSRKREGEMSADSGNKQGRSYHLYELTGRISLCANVNRSFCWTKTALVHITKLLIFEEEQGRSGQKSVQFGNTCAFHVQPIQPGWQIVKYLFSLKGKQFFLLTQGLSFRRPGVFVFVLRKLRSCVSEKNCLPFNGNFPAEEGLSPVRTHYSHKMQ